VSLSSILERELGLLTAQGLRRSLRSVDSPQGATLHLDGRDVINFSSNNYLGLADHPALRSAATEAIAREGLGAGAARLIAGNLHSHRQLEAELARFHRAEAALLFPSGYQANLGVLAALAGPEDVLFSDALNHASLIDGCRLSRARIVVYPHGSIADLRLALEGNPGRRRFIVTDSVFSMDGDLARLVELRRLADQHNAFLVVDEAHATGVLGPEGRGLAAALKVRVDVHLATLGKGLGTAGAYVTGDRPLVDYLLHKARSFVFTTAQPPAIAAAASAAVNLVASPEGERLRAQLATHVTWFAEALSERGLRQPGSGHSPIFPVVVGEPDRALAASDFLWQRGLFVQAIRPPTVPRGTSRLRVALMATHTSEHLRALVDGLDAARAASLIQPGKQAT
jgi:8-amino-7-oxononanoate synthase